MASPDEDPAMDLEGMDTIRGIASEIPAQNMPVQDMDGGLTPESYDVRANRVLPIDQGMPEEEQVDPWQSIGRNLGAAVMQRQQQGGGEDVRALPPEQDPMQQTQEMAAPQEGGDTSKLSFLQRLLQAGETSPQENEQLFDRQRGIPPTQPRSSEQPSPLMPFVEKVQEEAQPSMVDRLLDWGDLKPRQDAKLVNGQLEQIPPQSSVSPEKMNEELEKAKQNPWQTAVYGSTDLFASQPEIQKEVEQYTGLDLNEQVLGKVKEYEAIISGMDEDYQKLQGGFDESIARAKERIDANQATDQDKFYIGLALLMPLLVGSVFGAEAGFNALGGGFKGLADVLGKRSGNILKDEELIADLSGKKAQTAVKQGELKLEKAKLPETIRKSLPKDEWEHIKNMDLVSWTDPTTGKQEGGVQILPGIVAPASKVSTEKRLEHAEKTAEKLAEEKSALDVANRATKKVIDLASQIDDPAWLWRMLSAGLMGGEVGPGEKNYGNWVSRAMMSQAPEIMWEGRKQNAAVVLKTYIEQIKDAYRRNEGMRALTNTVAEHIGVMASNPFETGLKFSDLVDQMLILRDRSQGFYSDRVKNHGFYDAPVRSEFGKLNREVYQVLNEKEDEKEGEKLFKKLSTE